jgi:hypothetical protein
MVVVVVGLMTACADPSVSSVRVAGRDETPEPSATSRMVDGCPVTIPPQPGLVPPRPYPSDPSEPPSSEGVWYGTPDLWTILDSTGAVWNLPVAKDGHVGDKTVWFSEKFSTAEGEDFSGNADITITAVHLEGSAPKAVQKGGVPSFNAHIRNFILVGLGVPEPGCWEVTAQYEGAELSYVMLVKDDE